MQQDSNQPNITKNKIIEILKSIFDPEIPVDIYNLGLIYDINTDNDKISIKMTLTSPNCPSAQEIPVEIKQKINQEFPNATVSIELTWDPPWSPHRMSEEAQLILDMFGTEINYYHEFEIDDNFDYENYEISQFDQNNIPPDDNNT